MVAMWQAMTKRWLSSALVLCVALTAFIFVVPAVRSVAEGNPTGADRAAIDHTGPVGDPKNDPWPQSFPRDNKLTHKSNLQHRGRIALVFDFDARYTWETMGGTRIPNPDGRKPGKPNFEQSQQIKKYLQNLRGAPVSVGIYTFDSFKGRNVAKGNTPDLPATSLENKAGFDTVMRKLDSLDATGGTGVRKGGEGESEEISNQEQGLQKVINDMDKYHYTDVFLFTTGKPNACGANDAGCSFNWGSLDDGKQKFLKASGMFNDQGNYTGWEGNRWSFRRDGLIAAVLKAKELQDKGAALRIMHMYVHTGVNGDATDYASYMLGKRIRTETVAGGDNKGDEVKIKVVDQNGQPVNENITNQWITIRHAGNFDDYWTKRKNIWWQPEGQEYPTGRPDGQHVLAACNSWHGIGGKFLPNQQNGVFAGDLKLGGDDSYEGGTNSMNCNHIRDGKFGKTIVDWLKKVRGLAVVNDQVDQDLRFIKPNANRIFKVVKESYAGAGDGSKEEKLRTGDDGMLDTDTSGSERVLKVVTKETDGNKFIATEKITPFRGTDNQQHVARCVGWNVEQEPKFFYPDSYPQINPADTSGDVGFQLTLDQRKTFDFIKCAMYSRPLQEVQIQKEAQVRNEQIRFVVGGSPIASTKDFKGGAYYDFEWKCTDPKSLDPDKPISSSKGKTETQRRRTINGLNVDSKMPPIGIGNPVEVTVNGKTETKSMLPVGAKCEVTETIKLPTGISENQANQLFTSENEVSGRNYKIDTTGLPAGEKPEKIGQKQDNNNQAWESHTFGSSILYQPNVTGEAGVSPISQLVSKTFYESKKAGISLTLKTSNSDNDPAFNAVLAKAKGTQTTVPVYYNCRFMPDPTKPPELPETNQGSYPGYVEVGWAQAPVDGTPVKVGYKKNEKGEEVPAWPVGTHCLFSTSAPPKIANQAKPLNLPGFISSDKYKSTVCARDYYVTGKKLNDCGNNYFWVRSDGEQQIELTQDFTRQYGQLEVTKTLSGAAQSQGTETAYKMGLECSQENIDVSLKEGSSPEFSVKPGSPKVVSGVPAGTNCVLKESDSDKQPNIPNVKVIISDVKAIAPIEDVNRPQKVTIDNELVYKTGSLTIKHEGDTSNLLDDVKGTVEKQPRDISVNCYDLSRGLHTYSASITPTGRTSRLSDIPAGSTCTISADTRSFPVTVTETVPPAAPGKPATHKSTTHTVLVTASPVTVQISADQNQEATVTSVFSHPIAGEIQLSSLVKGKPNYPELVNKLPDKIHATVTCVGKQYWSGELDFGKNGKGTPVTIQNTKIPAEAECTLSATVFGSWPMELDGSTYLHTDTGDSKEVKNQQQLSFGFKAPPKGKGTSLVLNHSFTMATTEVELSMPKPQMWTSAEPEPQSAGDKVTVPTSWRDALLSGAGSVPATVTCKLGQSRVTYPLQLPNDGGVATQEIPRGWDCRASADPTTLKLRGTNLHATTWEKDSSSRDQAQTTQWSAADTSSSKLAEITWRSSEHTFKAGLKSNYRVQLASFNVKKKVGGEGVAMIAGDHLFNVKYSCTLNGEPIALPNPAAINKVGETATDTAGNPWDAGENLKSQLGSRLADASSHEQSIQVGRFQQGEWHPIDALPAGAVCTLEETPDRAKVTSARLDHYWEITDGYRSREPESKCESSSHKCRPVNEGEIGKVQVILPVDQEPSNNKYYSDKDNAVKDGKVQNPHVPRTLPENFAGTMVPWNNYVFEKTQVELSLKVEGNGAALMQGQTVRTRLYCKPPPLVDESGKLVASDANAAEVIKVPLNFKMTPGATADNLRLVANQQIPVNYRCVLAQENFPLGDAKLVTRLSYADANNHGDNTFDLTTDPQQSNSATVEQLTALFTTKATAGTKTQDLSEYEKDSNLAQAENENYIAAFKVPETLTKPTGTDVAITRFTLTNILTRPGVNLKIAHTLSAGATGYYNLGQNLVDSHKLSGYQVKYTCEDKYLKTKDTENKDIPFKYEGTVPLEVKSAPQLLFSDQSGTAAGGSGGTGTASTPVFVPASSSCGFQLYNQGGDPLKDYPTIALSTTGKITGDALLSGRFETERIKADRDPSALHLQPVTFQKPEGSTTAGMDATLTFDTYYFTEQQVLSLGTFTYGKESSVKKAIPEGTTFPYKYKCTYPNLPGMSFGTDEKSVTASLGQILTFGQEVTENCPAGTPGRTSDGKCKKHVVPAGTSCTITGTPPTPQVDYLKIVTNEIPNTDSLWEVDSKGQKTGKLIFAGKTKTVLDANPFTVTLDGQNRDKVIAHAVYRNGAKVRVRRTDPSNNTVTVKNASFDLYTTINNHATHGPAGSTSGEGQKLKALQLTPVTDAQGEKTGEYTAELGPGTYQVGTVYTGQNGAELLWQRIELHVEVADTVDGDANAVVKLTADSRNSGLVSVSANTLTPTAATGETTDPEKKTIWWVDIKDIRFGILPLTGGTLPWMLGAGGMLLVGATLLLWRGRRRDGKRS